VASVALHAGIVVGIFAAPSLFTAKTATWGTATGGNGGVNIKIVTNISGMALPAPPVTSDDAVVSENKSLYKSEPEPAVKAPEPPDPAAVKLQSKTAPKETKKPVPEAPTKTASNAPTPANTPSNAVPYGQSGGNPSLRYGQTAPGTGPTGADFAGDGTFGQRYGTYVEAMTRAITEAWRGTSISDQRAPRVYVVFTIDKSGHVNNPALQQPTTNPTAVERAALRAVSTAKLPPLPSDYRGPDVAVRFYFDYAK
jgi:TonB family protein